MVEPRNPARLGKVHDKSVGVESRSSLRGIAAIVRVQLPEFWDGS